MAIQTFDFEKPIVDLEEQIERMRAEEGESAEDSPALRVLLDELSALRTRIYRELTPWQRVLIARHMARPRAKDFVDLILTDWVEMKGDRYYRDDHAVICGLARFDGEPIAVIGQQKGKDTKENVMRNFGMMHPEGYRKALRVMRVAERFRIPILVLIDTPGAYPGIGAEERGQAEAIARNIMEMFSLRTPVIGVIIGEGASGGALGVGVVDHMMMLENSWYCVISPEGCASILWRDGSHAPKAADVLKLTAADLEKLAVIDETVPEPLGGAHRDPAATAASVAEALRRQIPRLMQKDPETLVRERYDKYRAMGVFVEEPVGA